MPRRDGTGPVGTGSGRGRGFGRMGWDFSIGVNDTCICPKCKTKVKHQRGVPCSEVKCPQCGTIMTRM